MGDSGGAAPIIEVENIWIPMPDGCRMAARIWLPESAIGAPVPAILEYIPYRKRDFMRARDEPIHRYFASHGYAAIRVDVRGTGDSDGVLCDEYTQQELDDALAVIGWIAAQDWCTGAVGMMGISWGGFNSLQVAALAPPNLKAIITVCSTDDRYGDDAHYMGGCLLNENMQWGSLLMLYSALPPDPALVGERWRDMWRQRIEAVEPFPALWMQHQTRDEYWKHGSVCENFAAIECAVYAIGGWADGYSNAVPRLLQGLRCPRKGLVGPWAHLFPHEGRPGPAIGFLQEAVRWWDHWLRGQETGIMDEPIYRVWMQDSVPPQPQYDERPGRWVAEETWPSPLIEPRRLYLGPGRLEEAPGPAIDLSLTSPQTTGLTAGEWCAFGGDGEMPLDQRPDDGCSLVFDGAVLKERLEILGAPEFDIEVAADRPCALLAVRLNDVAPDGASTAVTYGLLNLTHRDGHAAPEALEPGRFYRVCVRLNDIAHGFSAGHRVRLAISTCYWPIAWPAPHAATITLRCGAGILELPVRPARAADALLPEFAAPEPAHKVPGRRLRRAPLRRVAAFDLVSGETTYTTQSDVDDIEDAALARIESIDMELGHNLLRRHRIRETDPLSAQTEFEQRAVLRRDDWSVRVESRARLRSTRETFEFSADLTAFEGETTFARRSWQVAIPRVLV